jgi:Leucine-rich repeat (LRR) protein
MNQSTLLKSLAAFAAGLLVLACTPTVIPELSLSDLAANFEASGTLEKTISVTSNVDWTVSCPDSWVTVSPTTGSGNGSFKISVQENKAFEARNSTVTVVAGEKSSSVKVSQLGPSPSVDATPVSFEVSHEGATCEVNINSNSTWKVILPEFPEGTAWIIADKTEGEGSGIVKLTVLPNQIRESRQATVTIRETVGNTSKEVTITQEMGPVSRYSDSLALVAIYNLADGANWKDSRKWTLTEPLDSWPGIKLNTEGRVIEMSITNGTVTTTEWEIPAILADLTELSTLQIVGSKLKGEIPAFLYDMTKLAKIRFNNNNLTGTLSDKISQWTDLTELYLNSNKELGGSIPETIGQLKKLESINIAQTSIGGAIPQTLAECTALKNFMAYSNKLSGEIPDFWDKLPNIGVLQLYGNPDITGPIPASIGTLKKATGIQLKDCNLTGNIPASFGGLEKCSNLMLNGNKLSGIIPAEVQAHPKFQPDAGWKYLVNILPQQDGYELLLAAPLSRQTDSLALVAVYNAAKGANWKSDRVWDLTTPMDNWYGVKLTDGRVSSLNLANGTISESWEIPAEIGDLKELTNLRFINGKVTGSFPEEIYSLTKLESLYLTNNTLSWSISPKIADLTNLKDLYIDQNANLTGTLPKELGQLKNLVNINISKTSVSGAVPVEMAQCTALKNFMAFSAKLTSCPDNWDQWPALEIIMIYGNTGLEGPLPESVTRCKTIKTIRFDDCNFTGNIPESYANLPVKQGSVTTQLWLKGNKLSGIVPAAVQAHENWQATKAWKYETNILPQQEGYGLKLE